MADIDVTTLGTASCLPSPSRNVSSLSLRIDGDCWIFDVGEGTQLQMMKSTTVKFGRITRIFITHLHGDHLFGLPGLLLTMSGAVPEKQTLQIVGPKGLREYIRASMRFTYAAVSYEYVVHELLFPDGDDPLSTGQESYVTLPAQPNELEGLDIPCDETGCWAIPESDDAVGKRFKVRAYAIQHTVPTVGFIIVEDDIPGSLDASKVKPLLEQHKDELVASGVKNPMSLMANLKRGEIVSLPDGAHIFPEDVTLPPTPGRKFVILGDTCDSSNLKVAAEGCDLLVHEATNAYFEEEEKKSEDDHQQDTIDHGHSTPKMAGRFAGEVRAKTLLLTHFSQRYKGTEEEEAIQVMERICSQAKEAALGTIASCDDPVAATDMEVWAARDLQVFSVKSIKEKKKGKVS